MILIALESVVPGAWFRQAKSRLAAIVPGHQFQGLAPAPRNASGSARPLFTADDALASLLLLRVLPVAAKAQPETWAGQAMKVSQGLHKQFGKQLKPFWSRIPSILERITGETAKDLSVRFFASWVLANIEVLASALGRDEQCALRLEGETRLRDALNQGHGVILWGEECFSSSLLLKAAVASAGFQLHHLSRPGHNLSNTRYGVHLLNSIVRRAEGRYLAERIMIEGGNQVAVSRRILELLKENRIVSVTVSKLGSQVVEAPALDGFVTVATGAPHLALRSAAPLLPVFSYRDGQEYVVQIGEPIAVAGVSRDIACESAVRELTRRLDDFVQMHPLDWSGWFPGGTYTKTAPGPGAETSSTRSL